MTLIQTLWTEDRVTFDGAFYRTRNATIYDRPETPIPHLHRRVRPCGGAARRSGRGRAHVHERQRNGAVRGHAAAGRVPKGANAAGSRSCGPRPCDRDEGVVRHRSRQRALEDTRHWAALALSAEEKTGVEDAMEMERLADALSTERAASRWIVSSDPDEHVERIRPTSTSASPSSSSTRPARTSAASSSCTRVRCCRALRA